MSDDHYVVISADCHGGGEIHDYRPYLDVAATTTSSTPGSTAFENLFADLLGDLGKRNWDSDRRMRDLEADGVVAEVIFPNTIPPFFPVASLVTQPPPADAHDLELRWAGLQAHNRWLADFCARRPGRRAGIAQILLHDVDRAVDEIRWAHDQRAHRRHPAARRAARRRACRRCTRPTTTRSGRCARSSACRSTTTAAARRRRLRRRSRRPT